MNGLEMGISANLYINKPPVMLVIYGGICIPRVIPHDSQH